MSARRSLEFLRGGILHAPAGILPALMPAHGLTQKFSGGGQIEFHFDAGGITLNRFETNVQMFGYLAGIYARKFFITLLYMGEMLMLFQRGKELRCWWQIRQP
jgi:hypothetical protein